MPTYGIMVSVSNVGYIGIGCRSVCMGSGFARCARAPERRPIQTYLEYALAFCCRSFAVPPHREHRSARDWVLALAGNLEPVLLVEADGARVVLVD